MRTIIKFLGKMELKKKKKPDIRLRIFICLQWNRKTTRNVYIETRSYIVNNMQKTVEDGDLSYLSRAKFI